MSKRFSVYGGGNPCSIFERIMAIAYPKCGRKITNLMDELKKKRDLLFDSLRSINGINGLFELRL